MLPWRTKKIHLANQINRAGNNLLTDSHTIIPCLGQRGQKPYPVQRGILVLYRLYKGVLINLGEEPSKTIFRRSRISVLGIHPYRAYQGIPAQITVTEAHNSQSEFCWGSLRSRRLELFGLNKDRTRERPLRQALPLPSRVSLARPVFSCACYAGYVEVALFKVALSSNFMVFPTISALSLGREIHTVVPRRSVKPHRLPSNLRNLDLFANKIYVKPRVVFYLRGAGHRCKCTSC